MWMSELGKQSNSIGRQPRCLAPVWHMNHYAGAAQYLHLFRYSAHYIL